MDCILYIDLFFLWNFWMNALALFLVRQITRTYRTIQCLVAAALGALGSCVGVILYTNYDYFLFVVLLEAGVIILMNILLEIWKLVAKILSKTVKYTKS